MEGTNWDAGTDLDYLKELVDYWQNTYDWQRQEAALNQFAHFKTEVDGIGIHFIHERGKGPNPFPIILTHGYPDSSYRFAKIIPMLTDPESFGGRAEDSLDVVVPHLPGYGFSDKPKKNGTIFQVNDLWTHLMTDKLGYEKFGAHGGDWGSTVTEQLARSHPDSVQVGIRRMQCDHKPRIRPQPVRLLLGIFHGVPATNKSVFDVSMGPAHIVLYQKNIEAVCSSESEVRQQRCCLLA